MAGGDVADLVSHHPGQFGFIIGQGQQSSGDIDVAPRQGKGVHHVGVEKGEGELEIGKLGGGDQKFADRGHIAIERRVVVSAAIGRDNFRVLLRSQLSFLIGGHAAGENCLPGGRGLAAARCQDQKRKQ